MIGDFGNGVLSVVITLFIKIKIFGAFFGIAPFIFTGGFGDLNTLALTL